ncbi:hypothetical protein CMUS01_11513, partial [Colletotrichum musicola]
MPEFNPEVVANCLNRHYDLLVRMGYMPASVVQQPPVPGGV